MSSRKLWYVIVVLLDFAEAQPCFLLIKLKNFNSHLMVFIIIDESQYKIELFPVHLIVAAINRKRAISKQYICRYF